MLNRASKFALGVAFCICSVGNAIKMDIKIHDTPNTKAAADYQSDLMQLENACQEMAHAAAEPLGLDILGPGVGFLDILDFVQGEKAAWVGKCHETGSPSCAKTLALIKKIMDRYTFIISQKNKLEPENVQQMKNIGEMSRLLLAEIQGWSPFLERIQSEYKSVADIFVQLKTPWTRPAKEWEKRNGIEDHGDEITEDDAASHLQLTKHSLHLADTNGNDKLSYAELQDYIHMALELVGILQTGPSDFDSVNVREFDCIHGEGESRPSCSWASRKD